MEQKRPNELDRSNLLMIIMCLILIVLLFSTLHKNKIVIEEYYKLKQEQKTYCPPCVWQQPNNTESDPVVLSMKITGVD